MKKTKYDSFLKGNLPRGCKKCVKGKKMVLFVTGLCDRGCSYCPLSKKRKNIDKIYANERPVRSFKDIEKEVIVSNANSCSITGGDPLLKLERTIKLSQKLKKTFGKKFHIHIYVSTKLVTEDKLEKLSKYIDEIRFHPDFDNPQEEEIKKILIATKFWKKKNIGVEIPCFPDKIELIEKFVEKIYSHISFLNLNELEVGEFSKTSMSKKYKISQEGYTVTNSVSQGKILMKKLEKKFPKLKIHLCTARLKNWYQYRNRLKNYKIPKFTKKTNEGTIIYFAASLSKNLESILKRKNFIIDKTKNRIIINPKKVLKLKDHFHIYKIEEYPTYEREEAEVEELK